VSACLKIYLPKKLLECLPKCSSLPKERHRWNTNEEIAAYLITFEKHEEWLTTSPKTRPQNGSMILYNRKKVKYRKDGYCWKKRKDGKTTREDHMKLKVQGVENPDIVLVHYLNVPAVDDSGKPCGPVLCSINTDRKEWAKWSKEELIGQLKPMCESPLTPDLLTPLKLHHFALIRKSSLFYKSHICLSAAVFMSEVATVTGDSVYTTEHAHLIGSTHDATTTGILLAVAPDTQRFEFPGGVGLGEEGGELVLSSSLDAGGSGVNLLETSMNFDPDCFLNNPKQGQTYGGGGGKAEGGSCNGEGGLRCSPQSLTANGYVFNATLVNIKTEDTPLEQPLDNQSGYGGVKVLITGPWLEASREYSCLFDHISVPAALIQPGVLRCYCPAHETGLVMLQVAMGGDVISSSVVFEYKARDLPALPSSQHDWLSLDDTQFRMSILERLEQMEQRMAEITNHHQSSETTALSPAEGSFEGRVVVVCEKMMTRPCWVSSNQLIHSRSSRGMTLLHLAAAQGYAGLIQTLIRWRTKHADSIDLELEVDPLNVDHFSCTPLMWACALGHTEAALVLYQWDPRALAIPDSLGRLPLSIARSRGHTRLAELLEQLQQAPPTQSMPTDTWMNRWSSESEPSGHRESPAPSSNPGERGYLGYIGVFNPEGRSFMCDIGDLPPAKRLKLNPEAQQQPANPPRSQLPNLSPLNTHPPRPSSNSPNPHFPSPPLQMNMMMLAEHIMEATPDRIKQEGFVATETETSPPETVGVSGDVSWLASYIGDVDPIPSPLSGPEDQERPLAPQGLPSPADWSSFLHASLSGEGPDTNPAHLTLTEAEQRELYEAARHAHHTLRKYKGRPIQEQRKETVAVVQRCYKKYKQYALYKRMTLAAILIQSRFRSFHEQRKFQQSRRAAVLIQQYYRSYRHSLRYTHGTSLLTKRQNQAARKILRFLLRCRHRY
uniref:Calmodulin-binding transcription activator 1 n=1 Tax=Hucho hucho TaxID=62062 RepID=A0A4W5K1W3_9TELE